MQTDGNGQLVLPKNIRQMGAFGDTYKVYVEDFVYTYVHQFIHQRKKEEAVLAAVLLGKSFARDGQEYIFISGAQKVDFQFGEIPDDAKPQTEAESRSEADPQTEAESRSEAEAQTEAESRTEAGAQTEDKHAERISRTDLRQQEFWNRVYQRIKESFDDCDILGWYFNLDGSGLEIRPQLQKFFESTYRKGSRFLYYEDSVEKEDAFFVQEQHRLQRLTGYAVYYEKNPQMQEFMIAERERMTPKPLRESYRKTERDEVVENYRAIMNKLNEKPTRKKLQPVVYVAGAAVLAVVAAMGIGQIGNYRNLKVLEQTMQTLSRAVGGAEEDLSAEKETVSGKSDQKVPADDDGDGSATGEKESAHSADTEKSGAVADESSDSASAVTDAGGASAENTGTDTAGETSGDTQTGGASAASADTAADTTPSDYYIVQKGDSLVSISRELYGTTEKITEICNLNSIENMDMIYEGQKLLLP